MYLNKKNTIAESLRVTDDAGAQLNKKGLVSLVKPGLNDTSISNNKFIKAKAKSRTASLPVSSQWYAPAGSSEYIWNWFSGLTLTKYLSNESRVSSQIVYKQKTTANISDVGTEYSAAALGNVKIVRSRLAGMNKLAVVQGGTDVLSGVGQQQKRNIKLNTPKTQTAIGTASKLGSSTQSRSDIAKNRVMDLKLSRSHLKTELDVLVSHQNDLERREIQTYTSERSVYDSLGQLGERSLTDHNGLIRPLAVKNDTSSVRLASGRSQIIRLYQLVKRIEENNGRGVSAWPSDQTKHTKLCSGLTVSKNIPTQYTYTESNIGNALDAVISSNRVGLSSEAVSNKVQGLSGLVELSTMHTQNLQRRLPIKASFIAQFLATKLAAPKNKQSCMKAKAGAGGVGKNASTKNISYVLDMLKTYATRNRTLLLTKSKSSACANPDPSFVLIGAKISCAGRLQGVEMAKKEWSTFGRIQSNTVDVLKDKGFYVAKTRYGSIGVSVSLSYMAV